VFSLFGVWILAVRQTSAAPPPASTEQPPKFSLAINAFGQSFRSGEAIPLVIAVGNAGSGTVFAPNAFNGFFVRVWEVHEKMPPGCSSIAFEPFKSRVDARHDEKPATATQGGQRRNGPSLKGGPMPHTDVATAVPARSGMTWFSPNIIHAAGPMTCGQPLRPGRYFIRIERDFDAFTKAQTTLDQKTGNIWINISTPHQRVSLVSNTIEVKITAAAGVKQSAVATHYPD